MPYQGAGVVMDAINICIDANVFDIDIVARATHRYTNEFYAEIVRETASHLVRLVPMHGDVSVEHVAERFQNDLLDERLRARIREETSELHMTLVKSALREATSTRIEPLP